MIQVLHTEGDPVAAALSLGIDPVFVTHADHYAVTLPDGVTEAAFRAALLNDPAALYRERRKADVLARLANRRWEATQFFTYDGVRTQADAAMGAVTAAVVSSQFLPPDMVRVWKLGANEFRTWTITDITAFGMAISAHVQACFGTEADLSAAIMAAEDPDAIDVEAGWPA